MTEEHKKKREIKGIHVAIGLLVFFGIVLAANLIMIYLGHESWTGLFEKDAYKKGLEYNKTLERKKAQEKRKLWGDISFQTYGNPLSGTLKFSFNRDEGAPVLNAYVMATLFRPTKEGYDRTLRLPPSPYKAGEYAAAVTFPLPGQWEVRITALKDADKLEVSDRLVLDAPEPETAEPKK